MRTNAVLQCSRSRRSLLCSSWWWSSRTYIATQSQSLWEKINLQTFCSSSSSSSSSSLPHFSHLVQFPSDKPTSSFTSSGAFRFYNAKPPNHNEETEKEDENPLQDENSDGESTDGWEEEDETEPEIGDGGDGGGVVLQDVPWGGRVLSIANEVLLQFGDDMKLYSFKTSPRGYIYVRLDKLSNNYGCPSMEEIENYSCLYKKKLEEIGESGEIPDDLALEVTQPLARILEFGPVSSPGAERMLRVPDDLERFRDMPMRVSYVEGDLDTKSSEKDGVFLLESLEVESGECVWRLADVKENRDALGKGRPFGRKQKDWRLRVPFGGVKRATLYLEY